MIKPPIAWLLVVRVVLELFVFPPAKLRSDPDCEPRAVLVSWSLNTAPEKRQRKAQPLSQWSSTQTIAACESQARHDGAYLHPSVESHNRYKYEVPIVVSSPNSDGKIRWDGK